MMTVAAIGIVAMLVCALWLHLWWSQRERREMHQRNAKVYASPPMPRSTEPAKFIPPPMPDPDMTADQMRLHMGELTTREVHLVRAALKWAWRSVHGQDKGEIK